MTLHSLKTVLLLDGMRCENKKVKSSVAKQRGGEKDETLITSTLKEGYLVIEQTSNIICYIRRGGKRRYMTRRKRATIALVFEIVIKVRSYLENEQT